jgi:fibronectin type 3 domain-containing protein
MRNSRIAQRFGRFLFVIVIASLAFLSLFAQQAKPSTASDSGHSVTLTWQPTAGAKYYCVYRSTVSKAGYQKIGTSPSPNYKDAPVPGKTTFYYVVTAVDNKGESKFSNEIKAVVP